MEYSGMSYREYRQILADMLATGRYCDYTEVREGQPFVVLRHDVEFSVERAYRLHLIDNEMGVRSSYFFQITNNAYNPFARRNADMIREMHKNGQHIGLHYHTASGSGDDIARRIAREADIMGEMLGIRIDRFSLHRPKKDLLKRNFTVEGILNTYDPTFFTYAEVFDGSVPLRVKYIADSMHRWKYGYPSAAMFAAHDKIQLLVHPYSWTEEGYDNLGNFRSLVAEKQAELLHTLDTECMHFSEVKDAL